MTIFVALLFCHSTVVNPDIYIGIYILPLLTWNTFLWWFVKTNQ